MKQIKTAIVDDHKIFRDGFKLLIEEMEDITLVGEAENGQEFLSLMKSTEADLVFMDVNMPVLNGIEATKEVLKQNNNLKIIALSTFDNVDTVKEMIISGVDGYLLKNAHFPEIKEAVKRVMNGDNYFSSKILAQLAQNSIKETKDQKSQIHKFNISQREKEILELFCNGCSKKEIAEKLFISEYTVEKHKSNLLEKTSTKNIVSLVVFSLKNNLVELNK